MSEEAERAQDIGEMRDAVADRIENDGNKNLAETIRTTPAKQLVNDDYMTALKSSFPEYDTQLDSIKKGIEAIDEKKGRKPDPNQYFDDGTFMPNRLAIEIEDDYSFIWNLFEETLYVYEDGVYQDNGERVIKEECNRRLAGKFRKNRVTQVVEAIKTRPGVSKEKEDFRPPRYKINFTNGVYDLQKNKLLPHNPEYYFTQQIPWEYEENKDCEDIRDFMKEITGSEKDVQTLIEMVGYAMMTSMPIEHAFVLVGKGSNGKTMLLELLKDVLGKKNVKDENLQQLESNRFSTSWLYRKLSVISDDLPDKPVEKGGVIKGLTGGSDVRAEGKHGDGFEFENYALPIFAANHIPPAEDQSDGFFRRWTIIDFPYQFKPEKQYNPDNPMQKKAEPEMKLKNRIMDDEQVKGLVSQAVAAIEEVLQQGQFTYQDTPDEVRTKWNSYAEPVHEFINKYIDQGINQDRARDGNYGNDGQYKLPSGADFIVKDDLHTVIKAYCDSRSTIPPNKQNLTGKLKNHELYFDPTARTTAVPDVDGQARVYRGLEFTEEWEELVANSETVEDFKHKLGIANTQINLPGRLKKQIESTEPDSNGQRQSIRNIVQDKVKEEDDKVQFIDLLDHVEEQVDYDIDAETFEEHIDQMVDEGILFEPKPSYFQTL